jgi:hypothetical protein
LPGPLTSLTFLSMEDPWEEAYWLYEDDETKTEEVIYV